MLDEMNQNNRVKFLKQTFCNSINDIIDII